MYTFHGPRYFSNEGATLLVLELPQIRDYLGIVKFHHYVLGVAAKINVGIRVKPRLVQVYDVLLTMSFTAHNKTHHILSNVMRCSFTHPGEFALE
jgi:hypothetical protein